MKVSAYQNRDVLSVYTSEVHNDIYQTLMKFCNDIYMYIRNAEFLTRVPIRIRMSASVILKGPLEIGTPRLTLPITHWVSPPMKYGLMDG